MLKNETGKSECNYSYYYMICTLYWNLSTDEVPCWYLLQCLSYIWKVFVINYKGQYLSKRTLRFFGRSPEPRASRLNNMSKRGRKHSLNIWNDAMPCRFLTRYEFQTRPLKVSFHSQCEIVNFLTVYHTYIQNCLINFDWGPPSAHFCTVWSKSSECLYFLKWYVCLRSLMMIIIVESV